MANASRSLEARGQRLKGNEAIGLCPHLALGLGWCSVQELASNPGQLPYQELRTCGSLKINSYIIFLPFNKKKKKSSTLQHLKPDFAAGFGMFRGAGSPRGEGADRNI